MDTATNNTQAPEYFAIELDYYSDGYKADNTSGPSTYSDSFDELFGMIWNVKAEVVTQSGPGGGNPVVRFSGHRDNLTNMLADLYNAGKPGGESMDFYLECMWIARWVE